MEEQLRQLPNAPGKASALRQPCDHCLGGCGESPSGHCVALEIIDPGPGHFYHERMRLVVERQAPLSDRHAMRITQRPHGLGSVAKDFDEPRCDLELDRLAPAALD